MKITKLSSDRVKVFLSENDLLDMNIDAQELTPAHPHLGAFLYDILAAVRKETGFSMDDGQVIAEATATNCGIELMLSHPRVSAPSGRCGIIFEFCDKESLLGAIVGILPSYLASMRLYSYCGKFFLSAPRRRIPPAIYEFSFKNYKSPLAETFLSEHAMLIADAPRLLSMYFGIKKMK